MGYQKKFVNSRYTQLNGIFFIFSPPKLFLPNPMFGEEKVIKQLLLLLKYLKMWIWLIFCIYLRTNACWTISNVQKMYIQYVFNWYKKKEIFCENLRNMRKKHNQKDDIFAFSFAPIVEICTELFDVSKDVNDMHVLIYLAIMSKPKRSIFPFICLKFFLSFTLQFSCAFCALKALVFGLIVCDFSYRMVLCIYI